MKPINGSIKFVNQEKLKMVVKFGDEEYVVLLEDNWIALDFFRMFPAIKDMALDFVLNNNGTNDRIYTKNGQQLIMKYEKGQITLYDTEMNEWGYLNRGDFNYCPVEHFSEIAMLKAQKFFHYNLMNDKGMLEELVNSYIEGN